jgi:hypothetical protein
MSISAYPLTSRDGINGAATPESDDSNVQGSVVVIFTSTKRTLKALEEAGTLAKHLGTRVVVVAAQVVPYALPLDETSFPMQFVLRHFAETAARLPIQFSIIPYLCRSRLEALRQILPQNSPTLIGIRKSRWFTRDERLVKKLRRAGHPVIAVETD